MEKSIKYGSYSQEHYSLAEKQDLNVEKAIKRKKSKFQLIGQLLVLTGSKIVRSDLSVPE